MCKVLIKYLVYSVYRYQNAKSAAKIHVLKLFVRFNCFAYVQTKELAIAEFVKRYIYLITERFNRKYLSTE